MWLCLVALFTFLPCPLASLLPAMKVNDLVLYYEYPSDPDGGRRYGVVESLEIVNGYLIVRAKIFLDDKFHQKASYIMKDLNEHLKEIFTPVVDVESRFHVIFEEEWRESWFPSLIYQTVDDGLTQIPNETKEIRAKARELTALNWALSSCARERIFEMLSIEMFLVQLVLNQEHGCSIFRRFPQLNYKPKSQSIVEANK